ncbi:MAG TPA: serine/threonine-protein kinase [Gemmatimonadaceae bacterium]|nr:serine/threonine-protein kinase [Gemmatimonadaceae bacterium]
MTDPTRDSHDAVTTPVGVRTQCPQCGAAMAAFETRCNACGHQRAGGNDAEQREALRVRLQNGIGDAYELIEMIGKGGMGVVFRAREKALDREVALKVLAFDPVMVPEAFARFEREAKLAARLDHPHIVPIFAVGKGTGIAYYTMRLVRGGSLDDLLTKEKRLDPQRAIRFLHEIASALDHAHKNGVVHRDIKPANVMLGDNDHVFVADFGIARAVEGGGTALTTAGVVGSPAYMAPEQWQGQTIDGRADQYAFGILAYELLTGKRPYRDATMHELLRLHLTEDLPDISQDLSNATPAMRDALRRATAKEPRDRFETTGEFVKALEGTIPAGPRPSAAARLATTVATPRAAPPPRAPAAPVRVAKRRNRALPVVLIVAIAVVGAALYANSRLRQSSTPPVTPAASKTDTVVVTQQAPPETVRVSAPTETVRVGAPNTLSGTTSGTTSGATQSGAQPPPPAAPNVSRPPPGFVMVAHPGALRGEVRIDSTTTAVSGPPFAIPVSPGRHVVSFRNPAARSFPERVVIGVRSGDTARVLFVPAEGGGALGDSLRRQAGEMLRRLNAARGGGRRGGGLPPRRDTLPQ